MKKSKTVKKYDVCELCDKQMEKSGEEIITYCNLCAEQKKEIGKLKNNIDFNAFDR